MIIFESILTTFMWVSFYEVARTVAQIGSSFKSNHHKQMLLA